MSKSKLTDLNLYYENSIQNLNAADYSQAIKGFKQLMEMDIESTRSASSLIIAYSSTMQYSKAFKLYTQYCEKIVCDNKIKAEFLQNLTYFLIKESVLLKKNARGIFTRRKANRNIQNIHNILEQDKSNLLALVLASYWFLVLGKKTEEAMPLITELVYNPHIDDEFRWKLLEKLSITDKQLEEDITLAGLFKGISRYMTSSYINLLLNAALLKGNLSMARNSIEIQRLNSIPIDNDVMWSYLNECIEHNDIDDLAVNFAKMLFSQGWMDPSTLTVLRHAKENSNIYNVTKELELLNSLGL